MSTQPMILVHNGVWSHHAFAQMPRYRDHFRLVYVHDLNAEELAQAPAVVVPFQSNQAALAAKRDLFFDYLAQGGRVAVFGDSREDFLPATWEDRPINNYWWKTNPEQPPVRWTLPDHPLYSKLGPRHALWHCHGVYTQIPTGAVAVQKTPNDDIVTWQSEAYGGLLFASTKDPIVEHGIQQIRHLENYLDAFVAWFGTPSEALLAV